MIFNGNIKLLVIMILVKLILIYAKINDYILRYNKTSYEFKTELYIRNIMRKEYKLNFDDYNLTYSLTLTSENSYLIFILTFKEYVNININRSGHIDKQLNIDNSFISIQANKEYNIVEHVLDDEKMRVLNDKFLSDEALKNITKQESILNKYLSTKYLYWDKGIEGNGVKVGIFDSGINNEYLNCNLSQLYNFSDETNEDLNGHGTYISSVLFFLIQDNM